MSQYSDDYDIDLEMRQECEDEGADMARLELCGKCPKSKENRPCAKPCNEYNRIRARTLY